MNLFSDYAPLVGIRALILAAFVGGFLRPAKLTALLAAATPLVRGEGSLGPLVVQLLLMMGTRLVAFAKVEDAVSLVAAEHVYLASWAILILTYGILMPNTWQRALADPASHGLLALRPDPLAPLASSGRGGRPRGRQDGASPSRTAGGRPGRRLRHLHDQRRPPRGLQGQATGAVRAERASSARAAWARSIGPSTNC